MQVFPGLPSGLLSTPRGPSVNAGDTRISLYPRLSLLASLCHLSNCFLNVPCSKLHILKLNLLLVAPKLIFILCPAPARGITLPCVARPENTILFAGHIREMPFCISAVSLSSLATCHSLRPTLSRGLLPGPHHQASHPHLFPCHPVTLPALCCFQRPAPFAPIYMVKPVAGSAQLVGTSPTPTPGSSRWWWHIQLCPAHQPWGAALLGATARVC